jgi:hypothetical protein
MSKDKPFNSGQWTQARYNAFIKGGLRQISHRWPPKYAVKKAAWRERGIYLCAGYKKRAHKVSLTKNKKNNVFVDHINPVVDPHKGFESWDKLITALFCEVDGLQVLCKDCHSAKTADERKVRASKK